MPIELISKIKPKNDGQFPICEDIDIAGGYQVRTSLTDRDNIPDLSRKLGMLVYVQSDGYYYTLLSGLTNDDWEIPTFTTSSGTSGRTIVHVTSTELSLLLRGINYMVSVETRPAASITIQLPEFPTDGQEIIFKENANQSDQIIIDANESYIDGAGTYSMSTALGCLHLIFIESINTWSIISSYVPDVGPI